MLREHSALHCINNIYFKVQTRTKSKITGQILSVFAPSNLSIYRYLNLN